MNKELINYFDKTQKHRIFLDLTYEINKNMLYYNTNYDIKYNPNYVIIFVEHDNKKYFMETQKKFIRVKPKKLIPYDEKQIFNDTVYYKNFIIDIKDKIEYQNDNYMYIYDMLDNHNLSINDISIYYISVIDYVKNNTNTNYNDLVFNPQGFSWPYLTKEQYDNIFQYLINPDKINRFNNSNQKKINLYDEFFNDYNNLLKPFDNSSKNFLTDEKITNQTIILRKKDFENEYVNLDKIFNNFILGENYPFVALTVLKSTKIKFFKEFGEDEQNKKFIKKWSVLKKSNDQKTFYYYYYLTFKIKNTQTNNYNDLKISNEGEIMYTGEILKDIKIITEIITTINQMKYVFDNEPYSLSINQNILEEYNINLNYKFVITKEDFAKINNNKIIVNFLLTDLWFSQNLQSPYIHFIGKNKKSKKESKKDKKGYYIGTSYFYPPTEELFNDYTIIFRNDPKYEQLGLVEIYNLKSKNLLELIKYWINYILFILNKDDTETNPVFKNITKLKQIMPNYNSRDCQKSMQPTVSELNDNSILSLENSYNLNFKNNKFICQNPEYPYPGFTINGNVCCFKKDQRKKPKYIELMFEELNFLIRPTNTKYKNFPIILKDDVLYYIENNDLKQITDESIVNRIWEHEKKLNLQNLTQFFKKVVFFNFLYKKGQKINNTIYPSENMNCPPSYFLGFNYGYPLCFETEPSKISKLTDDFNVSSNYVINQEKKLKPNQLSYLPERIEKLFKHITINYRPYRVGIIQSHDSFLDSISVILNISKSTLFETIINTLNENESIFKYLNNGEIAKEFNYDLNNFIKFLNTNLYKSYIYFLEIINLIYKTEIIIIDKNTDKILCHPRNLPLDETINFIFILKDNEEYEPIIFLNTQNKRINVSNKDKEIIIKFYNFICRPKEFKANIKDIKYQIIDKLNPSKIKYFIFDDNFYLPVEELTGPLVNIPIISEFTKLPDAINIIEQSQSEKYKDLNIQIISQITDKNKKYVIGLLTSKKYVIPVSKRPIIMNLPIADFNYIEEIKFSNEKDQRVKYIDNFEYLKNLYNLFKYYFRYNFFNYQTNLKNYIENFIYIDETIKTNSKNNCEILPGYDGKLINGVCKIYIPKQYLKLFIEKLNHEINTFPSLLQDIPVLEPEEQFNKNELIFTRINSLLKFLENKNSFEYSDNV